MDGSRNGRRSVIFVCTHNSARSIMAEALLRHEAGDSFSVYSGGLEPRTVHPLALKALREVGVSVDRLSSKHLLELIDKVRPDYLITVCSQSEQDCAVIWPGRTERLHWSFEDPLAVRGPERAVFEAFRRSRNQIDAAISHWLLQAG